MMCSAISYPGPYDMNPSNLEPVDTGSTSSMRAWRAWYAFAPPVPLTTVPSTVRQLQTHPCHPHAPSLCFDPVSTASDLYMSADRHICANIMPPYRMTFVNATFTCRSLPLPHPNHPSLLAIHPSSVTIAPKLCRYGQLPHHWPPRWDSRCWLRCRLPAR